MSFPYSNYNIKYSTTFSCQILNVLTWSSSLFFCCFSGYGKNIFYSIFQYLIQFFSLQADLFVFFVFFLFGRSPTWAIARTGERTLHGISCEISSREKLFSCFFSLFLIVKSPPKIKQLILVTKKHLLLIALNQIKTYIFLTIISVTEIREIKKATWENLRWLSLLK